MNKLVVAYSQYKAALLWAGLVAQFFGQILTPAEQPGHPGAIGPPVPPEMIHGENPSGNATRSSPSEARSPQGAGNPPSGLTHLHQRQRRFVIEDATTYAPIVENDARIGFDTARWCAERGVCKQLNVPLRIGEKSIGGLLIWLPGERHLTEQQIELAYALAQQVTLPIRLSQLAIAGP